MTQWGSGWPADYGTFEPFGAPPAPAPAPAPRSRWPQIALFTGICAVALAFFPAGIGFAAIPVGIFGIVAGGIGLRAGTRGEGNTGFAIGGIVASVLAMALATVMFLTFYRSSAPGPGPTTSSAPTATGSDAVLPDGIDVTFGPYHEDGAQRPVVEMTVNNHGAGRPICMFTVHAVDAAGDEVYGGLGMIATLFPGQPVSRNVFDQLGAGITVPRDTADRLKDATFDVTKVQCR